MEFKDKLISIRKQLKLTQQQVADGVNVSRSVVAKWETGLVIPKENMIISLATFFNVPVTDLTTDDNEQAIKKESRKTNISLIILALIFIIIVLDLLDLLAINIIFAVISYIILCCAFLISIIKIKIPHKDIISFIVSIVIFLSFIITHFILCNNPYTYKYREVEGGVIITGYKNNITDYYKKYYIEIPSHIKGKIVKIIGQNAFKNSQDFNVLNLPETIEIVDKNSFAYSNISGINFKYGLKFIGEDAFIGTNVNYVSIPKSVSDVDQQAFNPKTILLVNIDKTERTWMTQNITYYNAIDTEIIDDITYVLHKDNTASVAEINKTGKVKILESFICNNNEYIVTTIGFQSGYRKSFEELIIPNTITKIEGYALAGNENLTKIHIPSSVIDVEENIFYYSPNVKISVEHSEKPIFWSSDWNNENKHVSWGVNKNQLFIFTAENSGTYFITTNNISSYFPNIEIIDYDYDFSTTIIDDTNVCIEVYLKKGVTYQFKVTHNETNLSNYVNLNFEYRPKELKLGDNEIDLLYEEYYYKFVPKYNTYYKFTDSHNNVLMVYDENLNPQSTTMVNYCILEKDQPYYVLIKSKDYYGDKINITVQDRIKIQFYFNISYIEPLETMWYSFLSKDDLYIPSRKNLTFIGWETSGGIPILNLEEYILNNRLSIYSSLYGYEPILKLYAIWEPNQYNINYYGINGEIIKTDIYVANNNFILDDSIKIDGYIILSWVDKDGKSLFNSYSVEGDLDCYPILVKEKSIVTFDLNSDITDGIEATLSYDVQYIEIPYGELLDLPVPKVKGFEFNGWYNGKYQVTTNEGKMFHDIKFEDDTVLEAKWVRTEYNFDY